MYSLLINKFNNALIQLFQGVGFPGGGGVLDISLGGEVQPGPLYSDPV